MPKVQQPQLHHFIFWRELRVELICLFVFLVVQCFPNCTMVPGGTRKSPSHPKNHPALTCNLSGVCAWRREGTLAQDWVSCPPVGKIAFPARPQRAYLPWLNVFGTSTGHQNGMPFSLPFLHLTLTEAKKMRVDVWHPVNWWFKLCQESISFASKLYFYSYSLFYAVLCLHYIIDVSNLKLSGEVIYYIFVELKQILDCLTFWISS